MTRTNAAQRKPIYAFDIETDKFEHGAELKPFACGLYSLQSNGKELYVEYFGDDCLQQMKQTLDVLPPGIVYAHNGGKFDMFFCIDWFAEQTQMMIIGSRLVRGYITGRIASEKRHEFRDSYSIIPIALKQYEKEEIDYRIFDRAFRNKPKNKATILAYLKSDCINLYNMVNDFWNRFGDNLTIGSTAMKELKKLHKFEELEQTHDKWIRPLFYYGGRVQCFESGIIKPSAGSRIIAYDINQCYPNVMRNMLHPVSQPNTFVGNEITKQTYFVTVYGRNNGAFPIRTKDDGLCFTKERGVFSVTIHEYNAAIETGMFECEDVIECINFERAIKFDKFVDKYHALRKQAQLNGDKGGKQFYKTIGNSAYGKFSQNPDNYYNYMFASIEDDMHTYNDDGSIAEDSYFADTIMFDAGMTLWKKRTYMSKRFNVATGASITGGARSLLIRALATCKRPLYCDTDSIICEQLNDVPIHDVNIGCWKVEHYAHTLAIGGRKMYALFGDVCPTCNGTKKRMNDECKDVKKRNTMFHSFCCIKLACKGAMLDPDQIIQVANGETVTWNATAPTINFKNHTFEYVKRKIKRTV
jgi:hypothetical protein